MIRILALVLLAAALLPGASMADIPDGSSARITAVPGAGLLRIANDKRSYTLPVARIVGIQEKSNGFTLWFEGPDGVQQRDFVLPLSEFLALIQSAATR
jgi:hypothetical protein